MMNTDTIFAAPYADHSRAAMRDYDAGFVCGRQLFSNQLSGGEITAQVALATVTAHHQPESFIAAGTHLYDEHAAHGSVDARHFADGLINGYRRAAHTAS